jgi:hypothetical protein
MTVQQPADGTDTGDGLTAGQFLAMVDTGSETPEDKLRIVIATMTKPEIMANYPDYSLFKSWSKQQMIDRIIEKEREKQ